MSQDNNLQPAGTPDRILIITHSHTDGTLLEGSKKGDGAYEALRSLHTTWRFFRSLGCLGLSGTRDKDPDMYRINAAKTALERAGFTVELQITTSDRRPFAETEASRYERAQDRADYHQHRAGISAARSQSAWEASHSILDGIPAGQPILVGHHSEGRHRRDLARADGHMRRSVDEDKRAGYHQERAETAEEFQARREDIPRTLRRIKKLEADRRGVQRRIDGEGDTPPATGQRLAKLEAAAADIDEKITYWQAHVATAEAAGVKVWRREDFTKGDFVLGRHGYYEVLRVNATSLTVPAILNTAPVVTKENSQYSWTDKIPYDDIRGRKTAEEMTRILKEIARREASENGETP